MPLRYSLFRPSPRRIEGLVIAGEDRSITYAEIGGSITGDHPDGYHWHSSELIAEADWDAACMAIREWAGHCSVGALLSPPRPPLVEGTTMAFGVRVLGVWATGTCRIVRVIDEPGRFGFSYGTLPHHPEEGEETFSVGDNRDGTVTFRVAAFSKPAGIVTRLIGPVGRIIQRTMTKRYLRGFAAYASSAAANARR